VLAERGAGVLLLTLSSSMSLCVPKSHSRGVEFKHTMEEFDGTTTEPASGTTPPREAMYILVQERPVI